MVRAYRKKILKQLISIIFSLIRPFLANTPLFAPNVCTALNSELKVAESETNTISPSSD